MIVSIMWDDVTCALLEAAGLKDDASSAPARFGSSFASNSHIRRKIYSRPVLVPAPASGSLGDRANPPSRFSRRRGTHLSHQTTHNDFLFPAFWSNNNWSSLFSLFLFCLRLQWGNFYCPCVSRIFLLTTNITRSTITTQPPFPSRIIRSSQL